LRYYDQTHRGNNGFSVGEAYIGSFRDNSRRAAFLPEKEKQISERLTVIGSDGLNRYAAEFRFRLDSITEIQGNQGKWDGCVSLVFSVDKEEARAIWDVGPSLWSPTDTYRYDGLFYISGDQDQPLKVPVKDAINTGVIERITFDCIKNLVERMRPIPDADVSESLAKLEELSRKEGKSLEDMEKMKKAIAAFATFQKPEPKTGDQCFLERGRCLTSPHVFIKFLKQFGINDVDTDHYGSSLGGFHQVNVWGNMCVDWTARQFRELRNSAYPYIYGRDEPHHLGQLYSDWSQEKKDETRYYESLIANGRDF
jgi:hypothetical protein